jgi:large subunit ribosomal protein L29
MNKAATFHDMTDAELREKLLGLKQELFNLRFQHATGQLKNPLILSTLKKDIARVMTIINEREMDLPRNEGKKVKKASGGKK